MLFYSQQDALVLKLLPVEQLQLIFNSCTNKNERSKRTFVCSLDKGRQFYAVFLGRKGKCYCPSATQKLQGTHLLWLDDLQSSDVTCAHWAKRKFSLIVWVRFTSRIDKYRRKNVNKTHQNKVHFGYILLTKKVTLGESFTLQLTFPVSIYQNCSFLHQQQGTMYKGSGFTWNTKGASAASSPCLVAQGSLHL